MGTVNAIWEWLDGKKTVFGAILLMVYGIPHLEQWTGIEALDIIYYIGSTLATGGIIHKVFRAE